MKATAGIYVFCICIFMISLCNLRAQTYPEIQYLHGFDLYQQTGLTGGPDSYSHSWQRFFSADHSPLEIIGIQHESIFHDDFGYNHDSSYSDFNGHLDLMPEYFIVRSPFGLSYNAPPYRISKIDYDGHYLEDCLSYSQNGSGFLLKAWYFYDSMMKPTETIIQYSSPQSWEKITCIRDELGRRLEDTSFTSTDSLNWDVTKRVLYTYGDTPFTQPYQFEKFAAYMPNFILRRYTYLSEFSMDDHYPLAAITYIHANPQGGWYEPWSEYPYYTIGEDGITNLNSYMKWNDLGILVSTGIADEVPAYSFMYENSTGIDDPVAPPLQASVWVYPNPVRNQASVQYSIPKASGISLCTYNLRGQLIKTDYFYGKGEKGILDWKATGPSGNKLQSGVYLLRFESDGVSQTRRIAIYR